MTNEEAKFILQAYRANGADAGDPSFRAALEQARNDAGLGRWWAQQQAFDRVVAAKIQSIEPPAGLLSTILTGVEVGRAQPRAWWRQPQWLAVAASLLVVFGVGLGGLLGTSANAADTLPVFATDYVADGFFLRRHSANIEDLRAWLVRQNAPLPTEIPAGFAQLRSLGCKTIGYRGKEVSLICFGEGKEYHLFVARREDFPGMPASATPQFLVRNGHASAMWSDETNHYVVVTDDSLNALRECLNCKNS